MNLPEVFLSKGLNDNPVDLSIKSMGWRNHLSNDTSFPKGMLMHMFMLEKIHYIYFGWSTVKFIILIYYVDNWGRICYEVCLQRKINMGY